MIPVASQVNISRALTIGGWMSERELTWLAMRALERELIVEFGSFHGRSTRALGDHTSGKVWAVDPWNGDYMYGEGDICQNINTFVMPYFLHNLSDLIASGKVIPVRNFSTNFTLPHKVDMVFIDGDHTRKGFVKDIEKAINLLEPNGLLCGHDYGHEGWPDVKTVVDEMFDNVKVEDTIWWTEKF